MGCDLAGREALAEPEGGRALDERCGYGGERRAQMSDVGCGVHAHQEQVVAL
jgi:hypothetical protein